MSFHLHTHHSRKQNSIPPRPKCNTKTPQDYTSANRTIQSTENASTLCQVQNSHSNVTKCAKMQISIKASIKCPKIAKIRNRINKNLCKQSKWDFARRSGSLDIFGNRVGSLMPWRKKLFCEWRPVHYKTFCQMIRGKRVRPNEAGYP